MCQLIATTWQVFNPVFEIPAVREWVEFIDNNLLSVGSAVVLFVSLLLWANL